jgi:hypothetical protein
MLGNVSDWRSFCRCAHRYFQYQVDEKGQLQYQKNDQLIQSEQNLDGLYLLHTNLEAAQCAKGLSFHA